MGHEIQYRRNSPSLNSALHFAENVPPVYELLWGEKEENRRQLCKISISLFLF